MYCKLCKNEANIGSAKFRAFASLSCKWAKSCTFRVSIVSRPAGSRSAGFTCSYLCLPISLIGLVNASLQKPPVLLG